MKAVMMVLVVLAFGGCDVNKEKALYRPQKIQEINARLTFWCEQKKLLLQEMRINSERWYEDMFVQNSTYAEHRIAELQRQKRQLLNSFGPLPETDCMLSTLSEK